MTLLVSAAALLIAGDTNDANNAADYAFYSLVIGVIIQIGIVVREGRKDSLSNSNRSPDSA